MLPTGRLIAAVAAFNLLCVPIDGSARPQVRPDDEAVRPHQMADLAVSGITPTPVYPEPGEPVEIEVQIINRAALPLSGVSARILAGNRPVGSEEIEIAGGETLILRVGWEAPATPGRTTLTAVVDPDQQLTEVDRSDNVLSVDVIVAGAPPNRADFAVSDLGVISAPGRAGAVLVTVRNHGRVSARAPLAVSIDGHPPVLRLVGPVEPGETAAVEIPWPTEPPIRTLSAEINPRYRDRETRPADNELSRDLRPAIDLRLEEVSVESPPPVPGRPRHVTVSARVVNAGRQVINTPFRTRIFPGVFDPDGWRPVYVLSAGLAPGQAVYLSHTISGAPEEFNILVEVDADGDVAEADETNNVAVAHYQNPTPDVGRWVSIGPSRITGVKDEGYGWDDAVGRLSAIAIPGNDPSTLYVGARASGVWKTADGGVTWEPISGAGMLSVAALAIDPALPSRIYLATQNAGVFRSEDGGSSWVPISSTNLNAIVHGGALVIHPSDPSRLFLASTDGVYRSTDFGETWQLTLAGGRATGLLADPSAPGRIFAAIFHMTDPDVAGVYRTNDGGDNWTPLTGCPGGTLPPDSNANLRIALSAGRLYVSYKRPDSFTLYHPTSIGCSIGGLLESEWEAGWKPTGKVGGIEIVSTLWGPMWGDRVDPDNVYLGGSFFWRSTNGGESFTLTSGLGSPNNSAHMDHHAFAADPASPNVVYSLNDGGIYRSSDRGASGTWNFISNGLRNVEVYDHGVAPTDPALVTNGTQDNGTELYDGTSDVWEHIRGGDGATVAIDPTDATILYSMGQYAASIARSTNGGASFTAIAEGLPDGECFNLHYQVHPGEPSTLLASCSYTDDDGMRQGGLWRADPPGSTWSVIFAPATGSVVRSAVDPSVDLYYAGTSDGRIYAGPSGSNWRAVFTHPTGMGVTDIEIDPERPEVLYASFGGGAARRVFRLRRESPTPVGLFSQDITTDLPTGVGVRTLAIDRMRPLSLFVGTVRGVYQGRSTDGGANWFWTSYNNGLPQPDVRELEVHPTSGVLTAGTFGRGIYEVNTDFPIGSILAAEGVPTLLRAHDVGTGYGAPPNFLDVEVVVLLDSQPGKAFGFQLRDDANQGARRGMLDLLRDAFNGQQRVRLEYVRTGFRTGRILRVIEPE